MIRDTLVISEPCLNVNGQAAVAPERAGAYTLHAQGAFSLLYRTHSRAILTFLARRCLDPEVARDLTAETFAQAFMGRRGFRGATEQEALAWLFGIARNQLCRHYRRDVAERNALSRIGIEPATLSEEQHARIEHLIGLAQVRTELRDHFGQLAPEQQEALTLRIVDERSYAEIAGQLQVSEPVVRARVSRGLRKLALAVQANPTG
jgi:RNA polymerase sigma factor (sigma-70 family)